MYSGSLFNLRVIMDLVLQVAQSETCYHRSRSVQTEQVRCFLDYGDEKFTDSIQVIYR